MYPCTEISVTQANESVCMSVAVSTGEAIRVGCIRNTEKDIYFAYSLQAKCAYIHTVDGRVFAPPGWLVHPATGCKNSYSGHVFRIYLIQFLYRVSQTLPKMKGPSKCGGGGLRPPPPQFRPPPPQFGDPFIFGRGL